MKKKIISLFIIFTALCVLGCCENVDAASKKTNKLFSYAKENGGYKITKYKGAKTQKKVVIPSKINGKPVTSIGENAFFSCTWIKSVKLPKSIQSIQKCAFAECTSLKEVSIPKSVTGLGDYCFDDCKNLKKITFLPEKIDIAESSFNGCIRVKNVKKNKNLKFVLFIGNSLTSYGNIPSYFNDIQNAKNKGYSVLQIINLGSTLQEQWDERKMFSLLPYLKFADTVVLQEYGGKNNLGKNKSAIKKILNECSSHVKPYMLVTEFDNPKITNQNLDGWCGLKLIYTGLIPEVIFENNLFTYPEIHNTDNMHPNNLYGYFSALMIYDILFQDTCSDFTDINNLKYSLNEYIKGSKSDFKTSLSKVRTLIDKLSTDVKLEDRYEQL